MTKFETISMNIQTKSIKLQKDLFDRYVLTPLSYWSDGSLESKDTGDTMITGQIVDVKYVRWSVFVEVLYEEYNDKPISRCWIPEKHIRKWLLAKDFVYLGDTHELRLSSDQSKFDADDTHFHHAFATLHDNQEAGYFDN